MATSILPRGVVSYKDESSASSRYRQLSIPKSCSSARLFTIKPIVRSPAPKDFNKWLRHDTCNSYSTVNKCTSRQPTFEQTVNNLHWQRMWRTTTSREIAALPLQNKPLPKCTFEYPADPVSARATYRHYNSAPMMWQKLSQYWDAVQVRESKRIKHEEEEMLPNTSKSCIINPEGSKEDLNENGKTDDEEIDQKITSKLSFLRPVPGYGGHIPMYPQKKCEIIDDEIDDISTPITISTARSSYRRFPRVEYEKFHSFREAPFTKILTLTQPYNPFNKIQKQH